MKSYSAAAADEYERFTPDATQRQLLQDVGVEVLRMFPGEWPGACAMISAAYAAAFQARSVAPVYVAAGQLSIEGVRVFGSDIPPD